MAERDWLINQFDEELVHMVATAIEGDGSRRDHADDLSCATCVARIAVETISRALRTALDDDYTPCAHCGLRFTDPRAAGEHQTDCSYVVPSIESLSAEGPDYTRAPHPIPRPSGYRDACGWCVAEGHACPAHQDEPYSQEADRD